MVDPQEVVAHSLTSTEQSRSWSGPRILWLQFFLHRYWAGSAAAGALLGSLVTAAVTWALRALPFAALAPLRAGATVRYLSTRMPVGVMVILVVYCLRDLPVTESRAVAPLAALAVTVGLHLWRRNALLSILAGTAVHVTLASTFFAR